MVQLFGLPGLRSWFNLISNQQSIVSLLLILSFAYRCLDLDSNSRSGDSVILSAVREEQLALLFQHLDTYETEIRITTKIEEANDRTLLYKL